MHIRDRVDTLTLTDFKTNETESNQVATERAEL